MGSSAQQQCSNMDNALAKGKCIIRPRPLQHCLSTLINPAMHTKLVYNNSMLLTYPKQLCII